MDKNEVIILSSDEENEITHLLQKNSGTTITLSDFENSKPTPENNENQIDEGVESFNIILGKALAKTTSRVSGKSPEIVDLVDQHDEDSQIQLRGTNARHDEQNCSIIDVIDIDKFPTENCPPDKNTTIDNNIEKEIESISQDSFPINTEIKNKNAINDAINKDSSKTSDNANTVAILENRIIEDKIVECSNQNLQFFTEFVEYCGSLEKSPNDRGKLTKKLMKRYGEAECSYIKSEEFRKLIEKCRSKVVENNLYVIAKEITDELIYRKKIITEAGKSNVTQEKDQREEYTVPIVNTNEKIQLITNAQSKKRKKIIKKVIKKLDKLGSKIRELEEEEVDLSDEETSSYVQLQRYRERFLQIYTKLCKYTNEVSDADRIYSRKICFTESKYPTINKCIENWLNKTKRFPDFNDIMKLLESQSSTLGLPSNREAMRTVAIEIFQKVGAMLQRRRIYDLWDSLCGFLGDEKDPAATDPILDGVLKSNFETRVKKEDEIFQYYVQLQEKQKLEPEEVPDEGASHSLTESGNEDEIEIEELENILNRRMDNEINECTEGNDEEAGKDEKSDAKALPKPAKILQSKETKNNYKNCKSLKWRSENVGRAKFISVSNTERVSHGKKEESDINVKRKGVNGEEGEMRSEKECNKSEDNSDLEMIDLQETHSNARLCRSLKTVSEKCIDSPAKRSLKRTDNYELPKKKLCVPRSKNRNIIRLDIEPDADNSTEKVPDVFSIHCCEVFFDDGFESFREKKNYWGKRKVFKDLTNVNRWIKLHTKKKRRSGLFLPLFFQKTFCDFDNSSWKKRFKMNYKLPGSKNLKCALNQNNQSLKAVCSNSGGDSDEKDNRNNEEGSGNSEGSNFFSGHGNGSEEDNNDDENKRNGISNEEKDENQHEEEDDEDEENENYGAKVESTEYSISKKKTEKVSDEKPSVVKAYSDEGEQEISLISIKSGTKLKLPEVEEKSNNGEAIAAFYKGSETDLTVLEVQDNSNDVEETVRVCCTEFGTAENHGETNKNEKAETTDKKQRQNVRKADIFKKKNLESNKETVVYATAGDGTDKNEDDNNSKVANERAAEKEECIEVDEVWLLNQKRERPRKEKLKENESKALRGKSLKVVRRNVGKVQHNTTPVITSRKNKNVETGQGETKAATSWESLQMDSQQHRRKTSAADEERVKRFLLHSPSSISITPPRKLSLSKPPSQAAMQALATLRNLKGISTTLVKSKPRNEDDVVVIGSSQGRPDAEQSPNSSKRRKNIFPVISNVQSMNPVTPKIVTVQGNVSGFHCSEPDTLDDEGSERDSTSIRISSVWGNLCTNNKRTKQKGRESKAGGKKKNSKKMVEYVVLD